MATIFAARLPELRRSPRRGPRRTLVVALGLSVLLLAISAILLLLFRGFLRGTAEGV